MFGLFKNQLGPLQQKMDEVNKLAQNMQVAQQNALAVPGQYAQYPHQQHTHGIYAQQHGVGVYAGYAQGGVTAVSTAQRAHVSTTVDYAIFKRCTEILSKYLDELLEQQLNSEIAAIAANSKVIPDLRYLLKYMKGVIDDAEFNFQYNQSVALQQAQNIQSQMYAAKAATQAATQYQNAPQTGSGWTLSNITYDATDWTG